MHIYKFYKFRISKIIKLTVELLKFFWDKRYKQYKKLGVWSREETSVAKQEYPHEDKK